MACLQPLCLTRHQSLFSAYPDTSAALMQHWNDSQQRWGTYRQQSKSLELPLGQVSRLSLCLWWKLMNPIPCVPDPSLVCCTSTKRARVATGTSHSSWERIASRVVCAVSASYLSVCTVSERQFKNFASVQGRHERMTNNCFLGVQKLPTLRWGGHPFHCVCANFYCNRVSSTPPPST